ncbi:MAG TPA: hypothetical protein VKP67_16580 [Xanthobacteraceae bacterium]|nr:hypothetical protein [Xanthobacteraceae bacterium]
MAIKIGLAAFAMLAVFAGVAPTLHPFDGEHGYQYSHSDSAVRDAEERAAKKKEAEPKTAEWKEAGVNRHEGIEAKIAPQSLQLQFLYTYYIWMQICAERFNQFDNVKAELREVLRSKEASYPSEQADTIWNATAERFQRLEPVLRITGDDQLYVDCDQNSRYVEGLLTLVSRMGDPSPRVLRKKDF